MRRSLQAGVGGFAVVAIAASLPAAITLDGARDEAEYSLVSTQINITSSPSADGGGPSGPGDLATSGSGGLTQLSNAYAHLDGDTLNLFIGGSLANNDPNDTKLIILLETRAGGVANLNGQTEVGSSVPKIAFDDGFRPNAYIAIYPKQNSDTGSYSVGGVDGGVSNIQFVDLTEDGDTIGISAWINNALVNTIVGGSGGPAFADATTGTELEIDLSGLGYTVGEDIRALAFPWVGGGNRTNNQILAPFEYNDYNPDHAYDLTYIDDNTAGNPGRQFTNEDMYPGNQFFTISAVPEPASLAFLSLAAVALVRRRTHA